MAALGYVGSRINVGGVDPNRAPPMVHDWAPGIQHSLGRSTVIEAITSEQQAAIFTFRPIPAGSEKPNSVAAESR